jgi:hypothetical protein
LVGRRGDPQEALTSPGDNPALRRLTAEAAPSQGCDGKMPSTLAVSQTARRLASGYYAFLVAQLVAANPKSINSLPPHPTGEIKRKDGTAHTLDLRHYLDLFRKDRDLQSEVLRSWAMGALLTLGDELSAHDYFDRAPMLELLYHLRNGVAHGNRFNLTKRGEIGWLNIQLTTEARP